MNQTLSLYQIDAFTSKPFCGNPAAVVPLEYWLSNTILQAIAQENNLAETAFFVPEHGRYSLRWFTPTAEVPLCGHATLAAGYVILTHLSPETPSVSFQTLSGVLTVTRQDTRFSLGFPRYEFIPCTPPPALLKGLNTTPRATYCTRPITNYYAVFDNEAQIRALVPDPHLLSTLHPCGVCATAPGDRCDFVSRYFAPSIGIPEDPVTGSTHCALTPFWAKILHKTALDARQLSPRGGELHCEDLGNRVRLTGSAIQYMSAVITIPTEIH